METVLIVIHLMVVLALVGVVLLQRSEGGGLGIGGSGFMTARGAANALTRATAILATVFFVTSLTLSIVARYGEKPIDILDRLPTTESGTSGGKGLLDQLGGSTAPAALGTTAPELPASGETTPVTMPQAASATKPAASSAEQSAAGGTTAPAAPQVPN